MLRFSGPSGSLYRIGDPLPFTGALEDCGDGFEWRVADPTLRFWVDGDRRFAVWRQGVWQEKEPLDVWPESGRVGFGQCYGGHSVIAHATCLPLSLVTDTGGWEASVETIVKRPTTLGKTTIEAAPGSRSCHFPELEDGPKGRVLARLVGWEPNYLFVGAGDSIRGTPSGTNLTFDEKGIVYVPA